MFNTVKKPSCISERRRGLLPATHFLLIDTKAVFMWDTPRASVITMALKELFADPWMSWVKVHGP